MNSRVVVVSIGFRVGRFNLLAGGEVKLISAWRERGWRNRVVDADFRVIANTLGET